MAADARTVSVDATHQVFVQSVPGGPVPPSIDGTLQAGETYTVTPLQANRLVTTGGVATSADGPATIDTFSVTDVGARTCLVTFACSQDCIWWVQLDMRTPPLWRQEDRPIPARQVAGGTTDTLLVDGLRPGATYHVRVGCAGAFGELNSDPTDITLLASPVTPP